jgi:AcrR family transcriptional regulator
MRASLPSLVTAHEPDLPARIVETTRTLLLSYGYSSFTMADLARELGVSKKTLYRHFPAKDAIVAKILDQFAAEIRSMADALFTDGTLSYTAKFRYFVEAMINRFSRISPHLMRDLQRSAPALHAKVEQLRFRNIPHVFGQLIRQGQAAGMVRADLDPDFAIEFWRAALQSLMHPDNLERLKLKPDQVFEQAITLFFGGLLTTAGRKDYEKQFAA